MSNIKVKHPLLASPLWMVLLFFGLIMPIATHAKIETAKLLYLREALAGKTTDKARMITLAAVTSLAVAQIGITHFYFKNTMRNGYFIKNEEWRNYCYDLVGCDATIEKEKRRRINNGYPILEEGEWNRRKEVNFRAKMNAAFWIPAFVNGITACFLTPIFYGQTLSFRPTTNLRALKYPLLFGLNSPGVVLYWLAQKFFFDYQHNLTKLLENYDSTKIPTIFIPTFDKLAAEYKKHKKIAMDKELQHFFVLSILRKIQEELLEEITVLQFPQLEACIEKLLNRTKPQIREVEAIIGGPTEPKIEKEEESTAETSI